MKHGFLKVAAITPKIKVADCNYNENSICEELTKAYAAKAKIIVFPELCITGYTCGDLFLQELLIKEAKNSLDVILDKTKGKEGIVFVGLPVAKDNKLYNVAAILQNGKLLAMVPKSNIPTYAEFYEGRHFALADEEMQTIFWNENQGEVPFGNKVLIRHEELGLTIGCEICEDLWVPNPPSTQLALAGANVIVNLSASNEVVGKDEYRELLVRSASARLVAGYIYSSAGEGESTQDLVFGGHNMIVENGMLLAQSKDFEKHMLLSELDIYRLQSERRKINTYPNITPTGWNIIKVELSIRDTILERKFPQMPFVPSDVQLKEKRCEEILSIQSQGLRKRLEHTNAKSVVIGLSGGLDSTLALLVTVRAFDLLGLERKNIWGITMPCFGTTDRTYQNACALTKELGITLEEINIKEAVNLHFKDIGQDSECHDITYENSQARERTQILMDWANKVNGLVIGTGDMSELALGWATYNGDHMSMYGVNVGVPKTLVRHLVRYYSDKINNLSLKAVLEDILDTPVSPELLPPINGDIGQKTEDLVGPYELHDFYLYYMLRCGFEPEKIYRIAIVTFKDQYEEKIIRKWIKVFYQRFFAQQFKRSCLPDGPKVGSVAISPRGDLRMPSDACATLWLRQIERL